MATLDNDDLKAMKNLFELTLDEKEVVTKKDLSYLPSNEEFHSANAKLMKELKDIRLEHKSLSKQTSRNIKDIEKLRKIHPKGKHQVSSKIASV